MKEVRRTLLVGPTPALCSALAATCGQITTVESGPAGTAWLRENDADLVVVGEPRSGEPLDELVHALLEVGISAPVIVLGCPAPRSPRRRRSA